MNEKRFDKLVDSVKRLDTSGAILSPQEKLDIVIKALYRSPLRFFTRGEEYLMKENRIISSGTGFFISSDGYLITNCHVIDKDSSFIRQKFILSTFREVTDANIGSLQSAWGMTLNDEQKNLLYNTYSFVYSQVSSMILFDLKKEINVLYRADGSQRSKKAELIKKGSPMPGKDLALLKIDDEKDLPMLEMSKDSIINIGEQVLVYGYPEPVTSNTYLATEAGIEPTLTSGIVSAVKKSVGGWPVIQMDAAISHGSSGSPVCNAKGEVIGVATFGSLEQQTGSLSSSFNFAIPVSVVKEFLAGTHIDLQESKANILFNRGLGFFFQQYYSRALSNFERAKEINKNFPGLNSYIQLCKNKIVAGEDRHDGIKKYYLWIIALVLLFAFLYLYKRKSNSGHSS
jgi:S1-C subfamily serine protease